jgi:NAD(P)-dependent dehydrogenase (short-subunit alcohol dehydrogenase family)
LDVEGKTAIVSGAGSGIGRATALLLARKGAKVILADIDVARGEDALREARQSEGTAEFIRMDATNDADLEAAIARATQLWGRLDIIFNNAGVLTGAPPFPATAADQWKRVVDLNLTAVIRATQLAAEAMRAQGGGVIVNTASMAGINPWAMDPVYSATKAGVVFFTKALEWMSERYGVRVNCVCPTLVETPLLTEAGDARIKGLLAMTRLKPEDIAAAVLQLIEDDTAAGRALTVLPDQAPAFA